MLFNSCDRNKSKHCNICICFILYQRYFFRFLTIDYGIHMNHTISNILRLPPLFYYVNNSIVSMMGCRGCGKESEGGLVLRWSSSAVRTFVTCRDKQQEETWGIFRFLYHDVSICGILINADWINCQAALQKIIHCEMFLLVLDGDGME